MNGKKWLRSTYFFLVMITLGACVEPFVLKPGSTPQMIVISGAITDQPGPYTVKVYTNQPVNRKSLPQNISKAVVTIVEEGGITETLQEITAGVYQTELLQGQIGKSYVLNVTTPQGQSYTSTAEKMLPVGNITNLSAEFSEVVNPDFDNAAAAMRNGFNLYADVEFDPAQESRAIWSWKGVFKFVTDPASHFYLLGSKTYVADPIPCSGFVNRRGALVQVGTCTCCECYHTQHNSSPNISDAGMIENNMIRHQWVGFIPLNPRFFTEKLFVIVQQQSASADVYKFWSAVRANAAKGSDLFQTPPVQTVGNITADEGATTPVVGLFEAYSVKGDSVVLRDSMVPYKIDPPSASLNSCLLFYQTETTTVRPSYYFIDP